MAVVELGGGALEEFIRIIYIRFIRYIIEIYSYHLLQSHHV